MEYTINVPDGLSREEAIRRIKAFEQQLQAEIESQKLSCYDLALELGVIGVAEDLPSDLSTNPAYFEGFGQ